MYLCEKDQRFAGGIFPKIGIILGSCCELFSLQGTNRLDFKKRKAMSVDKNEFVQLVEDRDLRLVETKAREGGVLPTTMSRYEIDPDDFKCPYCESKDFKRSGKSKSGKFRYRCKGCGKSYSSVIETTSQAEILKDFKI